MAFASQAPSPISLFLLIVGAAHFRVTDACNTGAVVVFCSRNPKFGQMCPAISTFQKSHPQEIEAGKGGGRGGGGGHGGGHGGGGGHGMWSNWTPWSDCSSSCFKYRHRTCQNPVMALKNLGLDNLGLDDLGLGDLGLGDLGLDDLGLDNLNQDWVEQAILQTLSNSWQKKAIKGWIKSLITGGGRGEGGRGGGGGGGTTGDPACEGPAYESKYCCDAPTTDYPWSNWGNWGSWGNWGIWGSWGNWSDCNGNCGYGERYRSRICIVGSCSGNFSEAIPCQLVQPCPAYGTWSDWSLCTPSCHGGYKYRFQNCSGYDCGPMNIQNTTCNGGNDCNGTWSHWLPWGPCSQSCGVGWRNRTRVCFGEHDHGMVCTGTRDEHQTCNDFLCPATPTPTPTSTYNNTHHNATTTSKP